MRILRIRLGISPARAGFLFAFGDNTEHNRGEISGSYTFEAGVGIAAARRLKGKGHYGCSI